MSAETVTIETMKADHSAWLISHAQWRQDIERWQKEHAAAVARLAELQQVVRDHGVCLDEHAGKIQQGEAAAASHEHEIAEFLAGTNEHNQDVAANQHLEREAAHRQQEDAHERIKKHHEAVIAKIEALESATAAGM